MKIPDRAVVTSVRLLVKVMEKHGLSPELTASLRALILKPIAVYESATERNSIVVVTIEMPDGRNPLLVAIRVDVPDSANKPNMHWMVSAYAKDDPAIIQRWEANGLLIWKPEPVAGATTDFVVEVVRSEEVVAVEVKARAENAKGRDAA